MPIYYEPIFGRKIMTLYDDTIIISTYGKFPGIKGLVTFCEKNNISTIPVCQAKNCNHPVTYNKAYPNKGFARFCSAQCYRASKTIHDEILQKLNDKEWLYDQRINLKKSKEQIAEELVKYLKKT